MDEVESMRRLYAAARSKIPVSGLTHTFYRYPARFSPQFVLQAITSLSKPGDLVLDPFMGGGTTVVEAIANGRRAAGSDVSELAVFLTRVKTQPLASSDRIAIVDWAVCLAEGVRYSDQLQDALSCDRRLMNMTIPRARAIKKMLGLYLETLRFLPAGSARDFARCILLNVGQWALHGKRFAPTVDDFREKFLAVSLGMLLGQVEFAQVRRRHSTAGRPWLIKGPCKTLPCHRPFETGELADLVVTSPPYPGVHVLYHRWQVDGRKETPAPFWIADVQDGAGTAHYNMASRSRVGEGAYFAQMEESLAALRAVCRKGAHVVQLVAFSKPRQQLRKYLDSMQGAGFAEVQHRTTSGSIVRRWRSVPQRAWHANSRGAGDSAREILLVHRAR